MTDMEHRNLGTRAAECAPATSNDPECGIAPLSPWGLRQPRSARDSYADIFERGGGYHRYRWPRGCRAVALRLLPRWRHGWLLLLWLHLASRGLDLGHARKA